MQFPSSLSPDDEKAVVRLSKLNENTDSRYWPEQRHYIQVLGKPKLYAEICKTAYKLVEDPIVKIWLLIEQIYGLRQQLGRWDTDAVVGMLEDAQESIRDLGCHPMRARLFEICAYHMGLVFRLTGDYIKSAKAHETAASIAKERGDTPYYRLELHQAAHERLNAAIVVANTAEDERRAYAEFKRNSTAALKFFPNEENTLQQRANIIWHQCLYGWVVEDRRPDEKKVRYISEIAELMPGGFGHCRELVLAIKHFPEYGAREDFLTPFKDVGMFCRVLGVLMSARSHLADRALVAERIRDAKALLSKGHGGELPFALMRMQDHLEK